MDESHKKFELCRLSNVLIKHNFSETGSASVFNAPKLVDHLDGAMPSHLEP
jgi:hypothetical protein